VSDRDRFAGEAGVLELELGVETPVAPVVE
jgi:hypothetical protein